MPMARAGVLASLVVMIALGGCAGSDPLGPEAGPAPLTDADSGAISGLVLDEEERPLTSAQVGILPLDRVAATDEAGVFILHNVPAGIHRLFVQALGFESTARNVEVLAGQTLEVQLTLKALPVEEPWVDVKQQSKRVDWGVRVVPVVGGYAGGDQSWSYTTEDRTDAMEGLYIEMVWQGNQALAGGMRLRVEILGEANNLPYTFCVLEGRSPLTCHVPAERIEELVNQRHQRCPGDGPCQIQWRGFTGTNNTGLAVDFGIMLDQPFTVYTSHFYRHAMPEGYAARPDE